MKLAATNIQWGAVHPEEVAGYNPGSVLLDTRNKWAGLYLGTIHGAAQIYVLSTDVRHLSASPTVDEVCTGLQGGRRTQTTARAVGQALNFKDALEAMEEGAQLVASIAGSTFHVVRDGWPQSPIPESTYKASIDDRKPLRLAEDTSWRAVYDAWQRGEVEWVSAKDALPTLPTGLYMYRNKATDDEAWMLIVHEGRAYPFSNDPSGVSLEKFIRDPSLLRGYSSLDGVSPRAQIGVLPGATAPEATYKASDKVVDALHPSDPLYAKVTQQVAGQSPAYYLELAGGTVQWWHVYPTTLAGQDYCVVKYMDGQQTFVYPQSVEELRAETGVVSWQALAPEVAEAAYKAQMEPDDRDAYYENREREVREARAEAVRRGWTWEWDYDQTPDTSWLDQEGFEEAKAEYEAGETALLECVLMDEAGEVLDAMGGIHLKEPWQDDPYKTYTEGEMAMDCLVADAPASEATYKAQAQPNPYEVFYAEAREEAVRRGWEWEWDEDPYADTSWLDQEGMETPKAAFESGDMIFMDCVLSDEDEDTLESLGEVALTQPWGSDPYKVYVEGQLAYNALSGMGWTAPSENAAPSATYKATSPWITPTYIAPEKVLARFLDSMSGRTPTRLYRWRDYSPERSKTDYPYVVVDERGDQYAFRRSSAQFILVHTELGEGSLYEEIPLSDDTPDSAAYKAEWTMPRRYTEEEVRRLYPKGTQVRMRSLGKPTTGIVVGYGQTIGGWCIRVKIRYDVGLYAPEWVIEDDTNPEAVYKASERIPEDLKRKYPKGMYLRFRVFNQVWDGYVIGYGRSVGYWRLCVRTDNGERLVNPDHILVDDTPPEAATYKASVLPFPEGTVFTLPYADIYEVDETPAEYRSLLMLVSPEQAIEFGYTKSPTLDWLYTVVDYEGKLRDLVETPRTAAEIDRLIDGCYEMGLIIDAYAVEPEWADHAQVLRYGWSGAAPVSEATYKASMGWWMSNDRRDLLSPDNTRYREVLRAGDRPLTCQRCKGSICRQDWYYLSPPTGGKLCTPCANALVEDTPEVATYKADRAPRIVDVSSEEYRKAVTAVGRTTPYARVTMVGEPESWWDLYRFTMDGFWYDTSVYQGDLTSTDSIDVRQGSLEQLYQRWAQLSYLTVTVLGADAPEATYKGSLRLAQADTFQVGDRVCLTRNPETQGTVQAVAPDGYQIRWDNGRMSHAVAGDGELSRVVEERTAQVKVAPPPISKYKGWVIQPIFQGGPLGGWVSVRAFHEGGGPSYNGGWHDDGTMGWDWPERVPKAVRRHIQARYRREGWATWAEQQRGLLEAPEAAAYKADAPEEPALKGPLDTPIPEFVDTTDARDVWAYVGWGERPPLQERPSFPRDFVRWIVQTTTGGLRGWHQDGSKATPGELERERYGLRDDNVNFGWFRVQLPETPTSVATYKAEGASKFQRGDRVRHRGIPRIRGEVDGVAVQYEGVTHYRVVWHIAEQPEIEWFGTSLEADLILDTDTPEAATYKAATPSRFRILNKSSEEYFAAAHMAETLQPWARLEDTTDAERWWHLYRFQTMGRQYDVVVFQGQFLSSNGIAVHEGDIADLNAYWETLPHLTLTVLGEQAPEEAAYKGEHNRTATVWSINDTVYCRHHWRGGPGRIVRFRDVDWGRPKAVVQWPDETQEEYLIDDLTKAEVDGTPEEAAYKGMKLAQADTFQEGDRVCLTQMPTQQGVIQSIGPEGVVVRWDTGRLTHGIYREGELSRVVGETTTYKAQVDVPDGPLPLQPPAFVDLHGAERVWYWVAWNDQELPATAERDDARYIRWLVLYLDWTKSAWYGDGTKVSDPGVVEDEYRWTKVHGPDNKYGWRAVDWTSATLETATYKAKSQSNPYTKGARVRVTSPSASANPVINTWLQGRTGTVMGILTGGVSVQLDDPLPNMIEGKRVHWAFLCDGHGWMPLLAHEVEPLTEGDAATYKASMDIRKFPDEDATDWRAATHADFRPGAVLRIRKGMAEGIVWVYVTGGSETPQGLVAPSYESLTSMVRHHAVGGMVPEVLPATGWWVWGEDADRHTEGWG